MDVRVLVNTRVRVVVLITLKVGRESCIRLLYCSTTRVIRQRNLLSVVQFETWMCGRGVMWMRMHLVVVFLCTLIVGGNVAYGWQQSSDNASEMWGGRGVTMRMTAQGATLQFDCAHGNL